MVHSSALSQIKELKNLERVILLENGEIQLIFPEQEHFFYIRKNELSLVKKDAPFALSIIGEGKDIYYCRFNEGKYHIGRIFSTDEITPPNISLDFHPKILCQQGQGIYINDLNLNIYSYSDNVLQKLELKGRLSKHQNKILCHASNAIWEVNKDSNILLLQHNYNQNCMFTRSDKEGNTLAFYSGRPRYIDNVIRIDTSNECYEFNKVLEINNKIRDVHFDDALDKWLMATYNGVYIFNFLREGSNFINWDPKTKKSEFGNLVTAIAKGKNDEIYFARETQGLFKIDDSPKGFSSFDSDNNFTNNSKLFYNEITDRHLLLGFRYDGQANLVEINTSSKISKTKILPYNIKDIDILKNGKILLAGFENNEGVVAQYDFRSDIIKDRIRLNEKVQSVRYFSKFKQIWVGTYEGLFIYDMEFKALDTLRSQQLDPSKRILKDHIVTTELYNDKVIVGCYGGGLYVVDPKNLSIEKFYSDKNGLCDNNVICIINDDLGNCWIGTFDGISVMDSNFKIKRNLYAYDGLSNREFNSKAVAKDSCGHLYFGSLNGITKIDPQKVLKWKKSYGLSIDKILAYSGKEIENFNPLSPFKIYNSTDSIVFHFRTPDYINQPFEKPNITIDKTFAESQIKQDRFVLNDFKVRNEEFQLIRENEPTNVFVKLEVVRDFRNIFKTLFLLFVIIGVSYLIARYIIKRNKKNEEEKTELNRKISQLQLSSLQSQMNPHFIFNALGAIQYFIQTQNTDKADEYLSDFAMLMRRILDSSKSKFISLSEELDLLKLYIRLESIRFEDLFDHEIIVQDGVEMDNKIPPMIIQPFVENAINHGLYNLKDRKGKLLIEFKNIKDDEIHCIVSDNGVGRLKAEELRLKKHKSRGMQIVSERIETINATKKMGVKINTEDLYESDNPTGTRVTIIMNYPSF